MHIVFKNFLYEAVRKGEDLILKQGTVLFHGTGEDIEGDLRPGGYDGLLWTSESSKISQSYIPACEGKTITTSEALINPNKNLAGIQSELGIVFDATYDEFGKSTSYKIVSPSEFNEIDQKQRQVTKEYYNLKSEYLNISKDLTNKIKEYEENITSKNISAYESEIDALGDKEQEIHLKMKKLESLLNTLDARKFKLDYVNDKLKNKFKYTPYQENSNGNYHWQLKVEKGELKKADYKLKGELYIITLKRDMKIYDFSTGEGDLNDVQYHAHQTFEWAKSNGYDGVKIDDFAQHETHGNVGHESIGFFDTTIVDLEIEKTSACHPDKIDSEDSNEYAEFKQSKINENINKLNKEDIMSIPKKIKFEGRIYKLLESETDLSNVDSFVKAYLIAAIFADSPGYKNAEGGEDFELEDFSQEAINTAIADCEKFKNLISKYNLEEEFDEEDIARDFWFTRNRHGVGFWDGDYGTDLGEALSNIAHQFKELNIEQGDDGKLYFFG